MVKIQLSLPGEYPVEVALIRVKAGPGELVLLLDHPVYPAGKVFHAG
jgi:hypothetical protein